MEERAIEWSKLFACREKIHQRYHDVWDIPILKKRRRLFATLLKDGMTVLDIGAGARGVKDEIAKTGKHVDYKSMDIDRSHVHDFYDIDNINEQFDVITLFEVIEHLGLEEGLSLFKSLKGIVKDKGIIIVSTPNIFNPSRFMRDSTHKTFYCYDELCGLLDMAGFDIKHLYRSFNAALHRYVIKVYLIGFLFRLLSIDYAYSIFAVGQRSKGGQQFSLFSSIVI